MIIFDIINLTITMVDYTASVFVQTNHHDSLCTSLGVNEIVKTDFCSE
jgi:hypothetical protein